MKFRIGTANAIPHNRRTIQLKNKLRIQHSILKQNLILSVHTKWCADFRTNLCANKIKSPVNLEPYKKSERVYTRPNIWLYVNTLRHYKTAIIKTNPNQFYIGKTFLRNS